MRDLSSTTNDMLSLAYVGKITHPPALSIGGLGGSGTRLFVDICEKLGFDFGEPALRLGGHDNLLFTHFFKRPDWFNGLPSGDDFELAASVFAALSSGQMDDADLRKLVPELRKIGEIHDRFERPTGSGGHVVDALLETYKADWCGVRWAWKEPNTHIFIDRLLPFFPDMKYIHVTRHGLDMAFSNNRQQFLNWSKALTGHPPDLDKPLPPQMLDFWLYSELRLTKLQAQAEFQDRILRVDYDMLCAEPADGIARITRFLDIQSSTELQSDLLPMIRPTSRGRYKDQDLSAFTQSQLKAVEDAGFPIVR